MTRPVRNLALLISAGWTFGGVTLFVAVFALSWCVFWTIYRG